MFAFFKQKENLYKRHYGTKKNVIRKKQFSKNDKTFLVCGDEIVFV